MLPARTPSRHRRLPVASLLTGLVVIVASAWVNCSLAQRPPSAVVGPDGFLDCPQKINVQALEGVKATAVDQTSDAAFGDDSTFGATC